MRIAVGGIEHETCGFAAPSLTADATTLVSVARTMKFGDELRSLGAANTIVDGLVRGVQESGHELVPLLWIDGNTSPPVTRQSLDDAIEDLLEHFVAAWGLIVDRCDIWLSSRRDTFAPASHRLPVRSSMSIRPVHSAMTFADCLTRVLAAGCIQQILMFSGARK